MDLLGKQIAEQLGLPVREFPADWKLYGKRAGPIRNMAMADYCDALIALWDGKSPGTKNMIAIAEKMKLPVYVHRLPPDATFPSLGQISRSEV